MAALLKSESDNWCNPVQGIRFHHHILPPWQRCCPASVGDRSGGYGELAALLPF